MHLVFEADKNWRSLEGEAKFQISHNSCLQLFKNPVLLLHASIVGHWNEMPWLMVLLRYRNMCLTVF